MGVMAMEANSLRMLENSTTNLITEVMEFFQTEKMLKAWNTTLLTIIPKHENANTLEDYHSIACCNTIYKVISTMLTNRLKKVLLSVILAN